MLINHQCIGGHASIPSPPHCEKLIDLMPNDIFCRIINLPPSAALSSGRKSLPIKSKGGEVGVVGVVGGEVSQHRGEVDCLLGTLRLWGQPGGFGLGWGRAGVGQNKEVKQFQDSWLYAKDVIACSPH